MISRFICTLFCAFTLSTSANADSLPEIPMTDLDGETVSLADTAGTLRVINFWATWCPPCVKEMPSLARLHDRLEPINGQVIAINVGEELNQVEAFILERMDDTGMKIWLDVDGQAFGAFGLTGLPMTLIVNDQGEVVEKVLGIKEWDSDAVYNSLKLLAPTL